MLKIENDSVVGWGHAIRGMRNPMNSWDKSDSCTEGSLYCSDYCSNVECGSEMGLSIGPNDHKLMKSLAEGGPVHAKYRRMIVVYLDITAPLYWWKEFDTYKVGTVANSCSTMHKIHAKEFTLDDFSTDHLTLTSIGVLNKLISVLNMYRLEFVNHDKGESWMNSKKAAWWQMIQLLPSSYNQKRTIMLNYEVLHNIYESRRHHKLDEWHVLCDWIERLPYSELITGKFETP